MKINEASVIDNKVIDRIINIYNVYLENAIQDECSLVIINSIRVKLDVMEHFKSHLKPLEPIIRDAWNYGEEIVQHEIHLDEFCHHNCDHINPKYVTVDQYINQTEI